MSAAVAIHPVFETAHDRFKREADTRVWKSLPIAVALHLAVLVFWPKMSIAVDVPRKDPIDVIPPITVDLPTPPEPIAPPARPVVASSPDAPDVTIQVPDFSKVIPVTPPAPPAPSEAETYTIWVPTMVEPRLLNSAETQRALERFYPAILREARIGGTVEVMLWLDETGRVTQARIARPADQPALGEAALRVVDRMRFSPALNRDTPVRVIVTIPVTFTVH